MANLPNVESAVFAGPGKPMTEAWRSEAGATKDYSSHSLRNLQIFYNG